MEDNQHEADGPKEFNFLSLQLKIKRKLHFTATHITRIVIQNNSHKII